MPKGIMGKWHIEAAQANEFLPSLFVGERQDPQSIRANLFLPIIPIGIVAHTCGTAFVETAVSKTLLPVLSQSQT